jgi:hypothetical protein
MSSTLCVSPLNARRRASFIGWLDALFLACSRINGSAGLKAFLPQTGALQCERLRGVVRDGTPGDVGRSVWRGVLVIDKTIDRWHE